MTRLEERIRSGLQETAERIPDTAPTPAARQLRSSRPTGVWVAVAGVVVVLVVFGGLALLTGGGGGVANDPVPTSSSVPAPASPFLGTWVSPAGGSIRTMVIQVSEDRSVEMVMHESDAYYELSQDAFHQVCLGAPSTMTGTGDLDGDNHLVFSAPVLTCDDGRTPVEGVGEPGWTPLEEHLQNLTFTHDPQADTLTDSFESVWTREGADPPTTTLPLDTEITELLNGFLEARIAGEGAQQYLFDIVEGAIPLIYATTSGAPYDRGEFEQVSGYEWPYGWAAFNVRMFAGDTVVEQLLFMSTGRLTYQPDGFATDIAPTTENGRPVASLPYDLFDGEVTLHFGHPWISTGGNFLRLIPEGVGPTTDGGQRNTWDEFRAMANPAAGGTGCQTASPANAEALAESIRSYPGLEATAPVAVSAGGAEGLMMDVKIGAGAIMTVPVNEQYELCARGVLNPIFDQSDIKAVFDPDKPTVVIEGVVEGHATGERMRLYLFDMPEGSSMRTMAIAIIAPESRFERAVEAAAPVVDSLEFDAP